MRLLPLALLVASVSLVGTIAACVLNPQPQPPGDFATASGSDAGQSMLADSGAFNGGDGTGTGVADGGGVPIASDAAIDDAMDGGGDGPEDASGDLDAQVEDASDGASDAVAE